MDFSRSFRKRQHICVKPHLPQEGSSWDNGNRLHGDGQSQGCVTYEITTADGTTMPLRLMFGDRGVDCYQFTETGRLGVRKK